MEWVTMPFGLCNALATFQRAMNGFFRDVLHFFVIGYIDDVCICNRTFAEHVEYPRFALQRFKEEGLKLRPKKWASFGCKRWSTLATMSLAESRGRQGVAGT
jgi:hypothetical protein